jgi:hypothetical protein
VCVRNGIAHCIDIPEHRIRNGVVVRDAMCARKIRLE